MVSIRNNKPRSLTVRYVGGSGEITFLPGINLNVPVKEWTAIKVHPVVVKWLESGLIEPLTKTPSVEGILEGFGVSTDSARDEPFPHQNAKIGKNSVTPKTVNPFDGLSIPNSEPLIQSASDVSVLRQWQGLDSRKGIEELIDKRIREIEKT